MTTKSLSRLILGKVEQFPLEQLRVKRTSSKSYFVYRKTETDIAVYSTVCPHAGADLSFVGTSSLEITCPLHHWRFDVTTGKSTNPRRPGLQSFTAKIEQDKVIVFLEKEEDLCEENAEKNHSDETKPAR